LSYGQSSPNKAGPIKLVFDKLTNQVQHKGKAATEQEYVLRDKEVLTDPIEKADEQIIIKISLADVLIKEIKGPFVISNLDQSIMEKITEVIVANDHNRSSTLALENFQVTWCPSSLLKTQRRKLQRARYRKLKQEGLAKMGEEIFNNMLIQFSLSQAREGCLFAKSRLTSRLS
jgi:hypothetical protein